MAERLVVEIAADARQLITGLNKSAGAVGKFGGALAVALGAGQAAFELSQIGAESITVARTFENLSGSAEMAAANLEAMDRATRGLVSTTEQQQIANQLLGMNIATTAEELEKVVGVSRRLGAEFKGLGAKEAADDFALMISNMSVARLDSFGLSSGRVRTRINELMEATEGMTREQAFFQATMEEADNTLARLGPELETSATAAQGLRAAWGDMVSTLGESVEETGAVAAGLNLLTEGVESVGERIEILADARENLEKIYLLIGGHGVEALRNSAEALDEMGINVDPLTDKLGEMGAKIDDMVNPTEDATIALAELHDLQLASFGQTTVDNIDEVTRAYNDQKTALEELAIRQARVDRALNDRAEQMAGGRDIDFMAAVEQRRETEQQMADEAKAAQAEAARVAESRWTQAFSKIQSAASSVIGSGLGVLGDLGLGFLGDDGGREIGENARRLAAIAVGDFNGEAAQLFAQERPELFKKIMESEDPQAAAQQMLRDFQLGIGASQLLDKGAAKDRIKRILLGTAETDSIINEITQELMAEGFGLQQIQAAVGQAGLSGGGAEAAMANGQAQFAAMEEGIVAAAESGNTVGKLLDVMASAAAVADYTKVGNVIANGLVDGITRADAWGTLTDKVIERLIGMGAIANPAAGRGAA